MSTRIACCRRCRMGQCRLPRRPRGARSRLYRAGRSLRLPGQGACTSALPLWSAGVLELAPVGSRPRSIGLRSLFRRRRVGICSGPTAPWPHPPETKACRPPWTPAYRCESHVAQLSKNGLSRGDLARSVRLRSRHQVLEHCVSAPTRRVHAVFFVAPEEAPLKVQTFALNDGSPAQSVSLSQTRTLPGAASR